MPRKKKRRHFLWLRKSNSSTVETDLLERGRTILNDIRIDTNPYQTRSAFIESIQAKSTLMTRLGTEALPYRENLLFALFEAEDTSECVRYHQPQGAPSSAPQSAPHSNTGLLSPLSWHDSPPASDGPPTEAEQESDSETPFSPLPEEFVRRRRAPVRTLQFCTIPKLIQHLLRYDATPDAHFISIFLLSYRTLLRPPELMELLVYRAFGTPDGAVKRSQWTAHSKNMQEKVLQFLCNWTELCFPYDFADDPHMMYMLAHVLYYLDAQSIYKTILMRTIGSRTTKGFIQWAHYSKKKKPPKPYIPKNLKKAKKIVLQSINPTEIARQLALVEFDIFCSINPQEFSNQNWCGKDKEKLAPNILRMIAQFNSISNWVASEILRESSVKQRAVLLHRFIIIAEESRALRNYNAVMAILSGLQSAPIYRLKRTWNLLPDRSWDIWDDLNALMNNENNFSLYRKVVRTSRPPRVPYIGVYLTDMVFIEDSHPDYLPHTSLVNVMKLEYTASVLYVLEGCKRGAYDLTPVPALQACLLATPSLSEEQQREQSLLLESLDE